VTANHSTGKGSEATRSASHKSSQPAARPPGASPVGSMRLAVWGMTDRGRQREGNEDAIFPHSGSDTFSFEPGPEHRSRKGQLLVVADGVGGGEAGREASHWAVRVAVDRYYDTVGPDLGVELRTAIETANTSLYQYLQSTGARDSGCTMTAAVIHEGILYWANVGDSRVYLIRDGQITQLTRDHTLTQRKVDQGLIRPEQAEMDPDSNVLTRSLGAESSVQVDLFPPLQLAPGDVVLLCSDGLTDMLEDTEIARLASSGSSKRAVQRLVSAANRRGGGDNISVVLARVGGRAPQAERGGLLQAASAGLLADAPRMARWQKAVLVVGAVLVASALCALGWWAYGRTRGTPPLTPTPSLTVEAMPTAEPVIVDQATATPRPTVTLSSSQATSTPVPTSTPTETPLPDVDGDGVPDYADDCMREPGLRKFNGCPDGDGDGVRDLEDECVDQPGLLEFNGCPDSDRDGLPDNLDVCPEQHGPPENAGCPPDTGGGDSGGGGGVDDGSGGGEDKPPPPRE